jgi:hypothetical protein
LGFVRLSRTVCGGHTGFWWCQMALVSVSNKFAFHYLVISGVRCSSCLWMKLVAPVIVISSVSPPRSPTLSWALVVRALFAGKLSSCTDCPRKSGAQIHLLAEDEGPKGPCPRSSVASAAHKQCGLLSERPGIQDGVLTWIPGSEPSLEADSPLMGRYPEVWLYADDEGPKGPCPRSSVASANHKQQRTGLWETWDSRCCSPESQDQSPLWRPTLLSDPKILGVLGCLWHGESSGGPWDHLLSLCPRWLWPERNLAADRAGFLCPCSCWQKPLWVVLEHMLRSTHQWYQDPGCARAPVAWRIPEHVLNQSFWEQMLKNLQTVSYTDV